MSSHYADLKAIPQAEMLQSQVVAHIVQTLHGLLPRFGGRIGIGFPAYGQNRTLGGIVRLFGSETDLDDLHCLLQNTGLSDYALIGRLEEVPSEKVYAHARFVRRQPKHGSDLRRAEKRMASQGLPPEEIRRRLAAKAAKRSACTLPHIFLKKARITKPPAGRLKKGKNRKYRITVYFYTGFLWFYCSYLPNRQLRNYQPAPSIFHLRYLPNRQLRKYCSKPKISPTSYLPNRQLRNEPEGRRRPTNRYLPNRQLRNEEWQDHHKTFRYLPNRQLRKLTDEGKALGWRYLPNRQLRNYRNCFRCSTKCYLPNRQLRNHSYSKTRPYLCYLPNRQLRNDAAFSVNEITCYLPNRQLRKYHARARYAPLGYLPNRQLRKSASQRPCRRPSYLPNRQLRNCELH